jgi:hypothetical protein
MQRSTDDKINLEDISPLRYTTRQSVLSQKIDILHTAVGPTIPEGSFLSNYEIRRHSRSTISVTSNTFINYVEIAYSMVAMFGTSLNSTPSCFYETCEVPSLVCPKMRNKLKSGNTRDFYLRTTS